jgi:Flp pilus assembly protein TadG
MNRKRIWRQLARAARDESGSELVEFAAASTLLLMVLFGIFGVCLIAYSDYFVSYAAQEGARYAMVRGNGWSSACSTTQPPNFTITFGCTAASSDVQNYVQSLTMPGINQSNITATTTWPGITPDCSSNCSACTSSNSTGCMVKVVVSYSFGLMLPFLSKSTATVTGTSEKVIQE